MKTDILSLKDSFKISYDTFHESRYEALKAWDMYHNRMYTADQQAILEERGQPKETFNIIKTFSRLLIGYYSTVVNTVKVLPVQQNDIWTASIIHDLVDATFRLNNFNDTGDKIKLDGLLTGVFCCYINVVETGEFDEFGRPKYGIEIDYIPTTEIALDPLSRRDDYSDARYIHRYKWIPKDQAEKQFGKAKIAKLSEYYNFLEVEEAEFEYQYNEHFRGNYHYHDMYLIVHTIITDEKGKTWSIYWSDEYELDRKEITYREVQNPYRVQKLHTSNRTEYYGIFREVLESQHAINQAIIKIQTMVNTQKAIVQDNAVENLVEFTNQFNRVNAVIPVKDLSGVRIENLTRDVLDQYTIIDKALDRVQRILSINDSFLGLAYASDSGSKVKLQQSASAIGLRHITAKIENFYRLLGQDITNLIKQYYTFHDVVRIVDSYEGSRWLEINAPIQIPTGNVTPEGLPETTYVYEEVLDPENEEPLVDDQGNIIVAPISTRDTEIFFTPTDIMVESVAYNDEDEQNQVLLEQFLNSPTGNMLSQINPVGYLKIASLSVRNIKYKYSLEISNILDETANMLGGNPMMQGMMEQGDISGQMTQAQSTNRLKGT